MSLYWLVLFNAVCVCYVYSSEIAAAIASKISPCMKSPCCQYISCKNWQFLHAMSYYIKVLRGNAHNMGKLSPFYGIVSGVEMMQYPKTSF